MNALFDTLNRKDLPEWINAQLCAERLQRAKGLPFYICDLFKLKSPLSLDEILVGLFRNRAVQTTRQRVTTTLHRLKVEGYVEVAEKRTRGEGGNLWRLVKKEVNQNEKTI